ncbi:MAG: hypothetical protein R3283_01985 [Balneolaceae bacterium]|nr:hypothetical protein [Balneolaceae bacterium]
MSDQQKQITLKPSHLSLFGWYLLGVLLIPLFGLGLYLIYRYYSTHRSISYIITDRQITLKDSKSSENIDLANITQTRVTRTNTDRYFDIGNVVIQTEARKAVLIGQKDPEELAELIRRAAEAERMRIAKQSEKQDRTPDMDSDPGTLDKRNYLTGLWQQGLMSDEDFEKEMKHFQ